MPTTHIIAMGGGGFSMEPENLLLDRYTLNAASHGMPRICFVPTASGDAENYIQRFYAAFNTLRCEPSHLSLFAPPTADLESFVLDKHIIYVGGGNTRNLLVLWKEWGLDAIMRRAWEEGIILAGISAGAACWFESCVTDSIPGALTPLCALGFLRGSHCPHYDGEAERRPAYHRMLAQDLLGAGYAADDGAALHFIDGALAQVVTSRPGARAYHVKADQGRIIESPLDVRYLGE